VMETVGNTLMPLTPDAAIVVVLSQALVLFIFSSQTLSSALQSIGLPPIPLVPVSSSQIVIGSIIGIGLYKGGKEIKYNVLGSISLGWLATPLVAGIVAFFMLFFVNNVFKKDVGEREVTGNSMEVVQDSVTMDNTLVMGRSDTLTGQHAEPSSGNLPSTAPHDISYSWFVSLVLFIGLVLLIYFLRVRKKKMDELRRELQTLEERYRMEIQNLEKKYVEKMHRQVDLGKELKFRQNEMVTMAMSIIHKNEFLNSLKDEIVKIKANVKDPEVRMGLNKLSLMITQDLSIDRDREKFQMHISEQNSSFIHRLTEAFPTMTDNEKRLASLLRLNLSSKEIASILNISPKSVEMNRYRLRKKLKVDPKVSLSDFIRNF